MKKIIPILIAFILIIVCIVLGVRIFVLKQNDKNNDNRNDNKINNKETTNSIVIEKEINEEDENNNNNNNEKNNNDNKVEEISMDNIFIKVNSEILEVELEKNEATKELIEKLKDEDVTIDVHEYGGFEKVGSLGFSLTKEDKNITTSAGDIVLYQGNQISIFLDSNSWSYTKLGKVKNVSANELKDILGDGDVILTLTLSK